MGDGINDFLILTHGIGSSRTGEVSIYNDKGLLVYFNERYGTSSSNLFTGHANVGLLLGAGDHMLPEGNYFYTLKDDQEETTGYFYMKY